MSSIPATKVMNGELGFDLDDYRSAITEVRAGKHVGNFVYLHVDAATELPAILTEVLTSVSRMARASDIEYNVVKFGKLFPSISLLNYPTFFDEAFPKLQSSTSLDVAAGTLSIRDFASRDSQPILHRKELLLSPNHPEFERFADLTAHAEVAGLFDNPSQIGTSRNWDNLLKSKELQVVGHCLWQSDGSPLTSNSIRENIFRYRTALRRQRLSIPVQKAEKFGLIDPECTFFDYGCGHGDDVRILDSMGITASGWDPHFQPDSEKICSDIVNFGYVLNVIEDPAERRDAVIEAFNLANRVLIVSVLVRGYKTSDQARKVGDGVLTARQTFQKIFSPDEIATYLEQCLGRKPIRISTGILLVFKEVAAEQEFWAYRASLRSAPTRVWISSLDEFGDEHREEIDKFWGYCLNFGRVPVRHEATDCDNVIRLAGSPQRLFRLLAKDRNLSDFERSAEKRKNDLIVEFALAEFGERLIFKYFPRSLQIDIKCLFNGYARVREGAKAALYSISEVDLIHEACSEMADEGVGYLFGDHSLQLEKALITQLPPVLRIYVGCAERLFGSLDNVDLVKIHIQSGKVSFMTYDDFEGRPVPDLLERVKVMLWQRKVEFFDYIGEFAPVPLFMKSMYLSEDNEIYQDQVVFDGRLLKSRLFDFAQNPPTRKAFYESLRANNLIINGYELRKVA